MPGYEQLDLFSAPPEDTRTLTNIRRVLEDEYGLQIVKAGGRQTTDIETRLTLGLPADQDWFSIDAKKDRLWFSLAWDNCTDVDRYWHCAVYVVRSLDNLNVYEYWNSQSRFDYRGLTWDNVETALKEGLSYL